MKKILKVEDNIIIYWLYVNLLPLINNICFSFQIMRLCCLIIFPFFPAQILILRDSLCAFPDPVSAEQGPAR